MSLTDRKSFLKILIIACLALVSISAAPRKISIDSVSLSAHQFIPAYGLENGGTVLYVSGSGFNVYGKGISVYFGLYQCNVIPQESTTTMVACKMSPMLKSKERQNLPITVYMVNSLPTSCSKSKCLFSFLGGITSGVQSEQTRILNEGSPILKAECVAANQYLNAEGVCQTCDDKANSPGTATSNHRACVCNSTYVWVSAQQECVCPTNFIEVSGSCQSCAPVKTRNGTGKSSGEACECNNDQFTFNVQLFKCVCTDPDSFVNAAGQCFTCSDKTENGTGKVNGTFKACACKTTFVWDVKLNNCYCPNGFILDATGVCFSCATLKGKNGTGLALPTNVCQCNPTYVFVPQSNKCTCPDPESYIDKTSGACFSCSNIANSTNKANIAARNCICNTNYTWNPAKSKTACLCPDNSFVMENDTCFLCSRLKGKNSTGLVSKANNFSCECLKSFVFNLETFVCQCPDEKSYIDKTTGQCVSCSNIGNGTSAEIIVNIPGKKCICKDNTYIWTPTLKVPACICPSNSVFLTNESCFICGTLKGKNGTGLLSTSNSSLCGCLKTFVFNPDNGVCECPEADSYVDKTFGCISCSNVENSLKTANLTTKQCNCLPTFVWTPALNQTACNCPPNSFILLDGTCFTCTKLKGKNGTGLLGSDGASCQCLKTYSFNTVTNVCECADAKSYVDKATGQCVPCLGLGNTTGEVNFTQNVCICQAGFVFTPSINKKACICPPNNFYVSTPEPNPQNRCVNCNTLKGNYSTGLVNKTTGKSCQCSKSFIYDSGLHLCVCPFAKSYIDKVTKLCIACTSSDGIVGNGTGQVAPSGDKCLCIDSSFIWTPTLKTPACICPANNIVTADGKCYACSVKTSIYFTGFIFNTTTCACKKSFVFNPTTLLCQCPDAASSYIDKVTNLCVSCVNATNGSGAADTINKKCICKDETYVWVTTIKTPACLCLPNSITFLNTTTNISSCFSCSLLKGALKGTGGVSTTNSSECACIKTFVFDPITLTCICPLPNSYINTTSNTCISCNATGNNIGNGTGQVNATSGQGCVCKDETFVWNPIRSQTACLCPPLAILLVTNTCFLCSSLSLPSATGKVNATNNKLCECVRTYIFNVNTLQCQCPEVSFVSTTKLCVVCSGVTVNGNGTVNEASNGCNCDENYTYSASLNRCLCQAPYKLVSGSCILRTGASSLSAASCPNDMIWDNTIGLCVCAKGFAEYHSNCIDCKTIENSTGQTGSDRTSCKCNSGYNWSANQFACISS